MSNQEPFFEAKITLEVRFGRWTYRHTISGFAGLLWAVVLVWVTCG